MMIQLILHVTLTFLALPELCNGSGDCLKIPRSPSQHSPEFQKLADQVRAAASGDLKHKVRRRLPASPTIPPIVVPAKSSQDEEKINERKPMKKAIIVDLEYHGTPDQLRISSKNADRMKTFLVENLGFENDNIVQYNDRRKETFEIGGTARFKDNETYSMVSSTHKSLNPKNPREGLKILGLKDGDMVKLDLEHPKAKTKWYNKEELVALKDYVITPKYLDEKLVAFFKDTVPGDVLVVVLRGHGAQREFPEFSERNIDFDFSLLGKQQAGAPSPNAIIYDTWDEGAKAKDLAAQTPQDDADLEGGIRMEGFMCAAPDDGISESTIYYGLSDAIKQSAKGVTVIGFFDCCHPQKIMGNKYTLKLDKEDPTCKFGEWTDSKNDKRLGDDKRFVIGISGGLDTQVTIGTDFVDAICLTGQHQYQAEDPESDDPKDKMVTVINGKWVKAADGTVYARSIHSLRLPDKGEPICLQWSHLKGRACGKWCTKCRYPNKITSALDYFSEARQMRFKSPQKFNVTCSNNRIKMGKLTFKQLFDFDLAERVKKLAERDENGEAKSPSGMDLTNTESPSGMDDMMSRLSDSVQDSFGSDSNIDSYVDNSDDNEH